MPPQLSTPEDQATSRYLEVARGLADEIWARRVHAKDHSVTWFKPGRVEQERRSVRIDPFLYDGTSGIALAFAALSRVTDEVEYRDRSLQTIAPLRYRMAELVAVPERAARLRLGLGGGIGLGALIYSFLQLARLLEEPALASEAYTLLALLTEERIASDESLDILYGGAGAILAMVALHRAVPSAPDRAVAPLEIALACARHLATCRSPAGEHRAWKTFPLFPPLSGFSHGAAGICYSLLRLYGETGEAWLLDVAAEGLAFERSLYSMEQRNWRDLRTPERPRFESAWCTGAPGIALARLGTLDILDDDVVREEIHVGLETTERLPLTPLDHLCCGNMGRVEILFQASRCLRDTELRESAERLVSVVLDRAGASGFCWRFVQDRETFDPTFFTGAAGVAYSLLRLVAPDDLACLLLLE